MNVNTRQTPLWNSEMNSCIKGAIHESVATAWLMAQGYEVFRNACSGGPVDMIATKGDEIIKIDVKTVALLIRKDGPNYYTASKPTDIQNQMGVKYLCAYNGVILGWRDDVITTFERRLPNNPPYVKPLQDICKRGHDLTVDGARGSRGRCVECNRLVAKAAYYNRSR